MVIPRENKLVRLYIQLTTTSKDGEAAAKVDRSKINPEVILQSAQRIIAPYKLTYRVLDWVSNAIVSHPWIISSDSHVVDRIPDWSAGWN